MIGWNSFVQKYKCNDWGKIIITDLSVLIEIPILLSVKYAGHLCGIFSDNIRGIQYSLKKEHKIVI